MGGVGGGGSAGVAGRGAEYRPRPLLNCLSDGDDHTAVLERARGIAHLQLEVQPLTAYALGQPTREHQGRLAFPKAEHRCRIGDGKAIPIAVEDTLAGAIARP